MASKLINLNTHNSNSLAGCDANKAVPENILQKDPPPMCGNEEDNLGWLEEASNKKIGLGESGLCDPMQTGQIVNDIDKPNRNVVYRYSKGLRACDEAVMDLFKNLVVLDEDGKAHPIPIIWATQEKAVAAIVSENMRKDDSLVVDRIRLPMLAIYSNGIELNQDRYIYHNAIDYLRHLRPDWKPGFTIKEKYDRDTIFGVARGIPVNISYTLYVWTLYVEDMNQLVEQVLLKFSPIAYIKVRGVQWETGVKMESVSNNVDVEPGDQAIRVIKYEFNLTAETYIPQPIVRRKAVLKTSIDFSNSLEKGQIGRIVDRLEEAVEELK